MPPLADSRREAFCREYFGGQKSGTQAAIDAGYAPRSAHTAATRLMQIDYVKERIAELQQEAVSAKIMTVIERKETLSEIGRGRITDFVTAGADGGWINVGPEGCNTAAIQEITSTTEYDDKGANAAVVTKLKLRDPVSAIKELNSMEGVYPAQKHEVTGKDGAELKPTVNINVRSETAKKLTEGIMNGEGTG